MRTEIALLILIGIPIVGMSAFTLAFLLRYTDGPFDVFARIRRLVGLEIPIFYYHVVPDRIAGWMIDDDPDGYFARLLNCFWCSSTVFAFLFAVLYVAITGGWLFLIFLWLASTGLSGFLFEMMAD